MKKLEKGGEEISSYSLIHKSNSFFHIIIHKVLMGFTPIIRAFLLRKKREFIYLSSLTTTVTTKLYKCRY